MKKILLFFVLVFAMPLSVSANTIHSIDIDVYIDEFGNADITEVWDVDGTDGTEWYKVINNMGNMKLSDFTVSMDGIDLKYKEWDVDEGLEEKKGYYGINYHEFISSLLELCFGKYDYNRHIFTLNYKLSNFVFNTDDSQVIYYNFIDKLSDVDFRNFSVTISSYYEFPQTLDVWGYKYEGYAYVKDGKIFMSNYENNNMNNRSSVLLVKFPLGVFNTSNSFSYYKDFNSVYERANYKPNNNSNNNGNNNSNSDDNKLYTDMIIHIVIYSLFGSLFPFIIYFVKVLFVLFVDFVIREVQLLFKKYGYIGNKKIKLREVPTYRDIPCNKDIYYAHVLLKLNNSRCYKKGNLIGAIILKWVRNNKIVFRNEKDRIFNKGKSVIDLTLNPTFDNIYEEQLFEMMYEASNDGYLKAIEFERWCKKNYELLLDLIEAIENNVIDNLKADFMLYHRITKEECRQPEVMSDQLYEDSVKLYGLLKYLKMFSNMNTKEVMDVKLWDEYLMFAYLFGIADKVSKQLKHKYLEISYQLEKYNIDYNTIRYIEHVSLRSAKIATLTRNISSLTSSSGGSFDTGGYSSGGGGFSSSGGGGGSFGGGGGGSR